MSTLGDTNRAFEILSDMSRATDKLDQLKQSARTIDNFKEVLWYALNPYQKYYVTKVQGSVKARPKEGTIGWPEMKQLLDRLSSRKATGAAAQAEIAELGNQLAPAEFKLLLKILNKDLRCGVGAKLVNKLWKGFIPEFGLMLCEPLDESHLTRFQGNLVYHQAKKNGDRCVVVCPLGGEPTVLSRKGYQLLNYNTIAQALQKVTDEIHVGMVWDGEVINGDFFKTRGTKKLAGNEAVGSVFHCFDAVQLEQWEAGSTDSFKKRLADLRGITRSSVWKAQECLTRVRTFVLDEGAKTMEGLTALRDAYKAGGDEGLILRLNDSYNFKSRLSCFKYKKMDTMDCTLLEILPGEEGKKHEHHAGSMMVELDNGQECKAGLRAGMKVRDDLWDRRGEIVGMTVEIEYQDKTVNKAGEYKLQFPVWTGIVREDKS